MNLLAVSDLELIRTDTESDHPRALVRIPDGKSRYVYPGTKIGDRRGEVTAIEEGRVVFVEEVRSRNGKKVMRKSVLKSDHPYSSIPDTHLSLLRVEKIVESRDGNAAVVRTPDGKKHLVKVGARLGIQAGVVVDINKDEVIVGVQREDYKGRPFVQNVPLKPVAREVEAVNKPANDKPAAVKQGTAASVKVNASEKARPEGQTSSLMSPGKGRPARAQSGNEKGLVAYYPFDSVYSGAGDNGSRITVKGVNLATDRSGLAKAAWHFEAGSSYLEIDWDDLEIATPFEASISLWAKISDHTSMHGTLFSRTRLKNDGFALSFFGPSNYPKSEIFYWWVSGYGCEFKPESPYDRWIHIAVSADRLFVDGKMVCEIPERKYNPTSEVFRIGSWRPEWKVRSFTGDMDEFRIYNRPLSDAEIKLLASDR